MKPKELGDFAKQKTNEINTAYSRLKTDNKFRVIMLLLLSAILFIQILILVELKSTRIPTYGDLRAAKDSNERRKLMERRPMIKSYE
jgi:1,4-dihydroxy-2-naphthoate octaprenyltransferase|tara:strand:+ start:242 stop:502 length:261 start_codon:yes stop_codon:yes gene_type:complete